MAACHEAAEPRGAVQHGVVHSGNATAHGPRVPHLPSQYGLTPSCHRRWPGCRSHRIPARRDLIGDQFVPCEQSVPQASTLSRCCSRTWRAICFWVSSNSSTAARLVASAITGPQVGVGRSRPVSGRHVDQRADHTGRTPSAPRPSWRSSDPNSARWRSHRRTVPRPPSLRTRFGSVPTVHYDCA